MDLTGKRWMILGVSCLINLCIGSLYAWSVFASPMETYLQEKLGISVVTGGLAIVFTVANSLGPITMIFGGKINDLIGPKWVIFVGGFLFGGGMWLSGFARSVGTLVLTYGILCGLGMGLVYGSTIGNSVKLFPDKRGLIGGITTASYGISSVIIPPVANVVISSLGVTVAFKILGIVFLLIISTAALLVERCPADYAPPGWKPTSSFEKGVQMVNVQNWKQMLSTPIFYVMLIMLTCGAFCGLMCISQASTLARKMVGLSVVAATTGVSVLALFNVAGRVIAGYISDRIGRINTLAAAFFLSIIGLILLYYSGQGDIAIFYTGISVVGLCFGAFMGIYPGFTADQFGAKHNSVNYGIMFIGFALAGVFGPTIMSNVYNTDGSYGRAFVIAAVLAVVGLILTSVYRGWTKAQVKQVNHGGGSSIY
jgi:OFA family oxalate/formate antiporter-like MFS transporter